MTVKELICELILLEPNLVVKTLDMLEEGGGWEVVDVTLVEQRNEAVFIS
jgi:hypothetical protein